MYGCTGLVVLAMNFNFLIQIDESIQRKVFSASFHRGGTSSRNFRFEIQKKRKPDLKRLVGCRSFPLRNR